MVVDVRISIIEIKCTLVLSIKYFFIVPIVFTGIALLGFAISLIIKLRK